MEERERRREWDEERVRWRESDEREMKRKMTREKRQKRENDNQIWERDIKIVIGERVKKREREWERVKIKKWYPNLCDYSIAPSSQ